MSIAEKKLVLHTYWRSSASHRVRLALGYKGLAYEPIFVNLLEGEQKKDEYKAKSPTGYLPCLVLDGEYFVESTAIMELLEELHPEPPLLPGTALVRARIRALVQIVNAGIQPLQNLNVLDQLGEDKERRLAWLRHFISRGLGAFEQLADEKGPFAGGDRFGMADCTLLPQLYAARRYGIDLAPFPRIRRAEEAAKDLPFVRAAYPDAQPDAKP
jgi:maleylacetoacetate isomerase